MRPLGDGMSVDAEKVGDFGQGENVGQVGHVHRFILVDLTRQVP
jgi:hypothetical protein